VAVVGQAASGEEAVRAIDSLQPDLVLLDIQIPTFDGFEVLRRVRVVPSAVIFVTAYGHHSIRAFEAGATNYLLKPVRNDKLRAAVERVQVVSRRTKQAAEANARTPNVISGASGRRVFGRRGGEYYLLNLDDVVAFRAEGELVWIVTNERQYLSNKTLAEITRQFEGSQFRRIHRGTLINMEHVSKMSKLTNHRWLVTMSNKQEFVVSKRRTHTIREVLHS
jgi:DNA-binding LytR/AlgR family response regulator